MTYAEYVQFLLRYLWRDGDPVLEADAGILMRMGEARLSRDLLGLPRLEETTTTLVVTGQSFPVPNDYKAARTIYSADTGRPFAYVPPYELAKLRAVGDLAYNYSYSNADLLFAGPMSDDTPLNLIMTYSAKVPSYEDTGSSWLADEYSDLYLYAALRNTAGYLREDPRVGLWRSEYDSALESTMNEARLRQFVGGQLEMPMPEGSA